MSSRLASVLRALAISIAIVAAAFDIAWALATLSSRPLDGVEGEVLFEASRIRAGLPLYVDPIRGAQEYGPVPSRFLVLYPPLWPALLSLVPDPARLVTARLAGLTSFLAAVGLVVALAPKRHRRAALIAGAFVVGAYPLVLYGASGRPDGPALLLATLALLRCVRREKLDPLAAALFVLAFWTKPNVVGLFPGAVIGAMLSARRDEGVRASLIRAFVASALLCGLIVLSLHLASRGMWKDHFLASTAQPPSLALWGFQLRTRLPFFGGFLALAFATGYASRRIPGTAIALCALTSSVAWSFLSLAKIGSASNYFLEPCLGALIIVSCAPLPHVVSATDARRGAGAIVIGAVAVLQALWVGVATVQSTAHGITVARERSRALASARSTCDSKTEDVVIADEPGLELMMNGRIVTTPFQLTHLARRGRYPLALWIADIQEPSVTCLVMQNDLLERPLDDVSPEHDRFGPELRRALQRRFELRATRAGYFVYGLRAR